MRGTMNRRHPGVLAGLRKRGAAVVALAALLQGTALANPTGPQVISGQASFSATGTTLAITNSPNAIINWNSFSINPGELTRFIQQSSASAVLNRVIGGNASAIYGALQSNGKVFLINQNGILFGPGAQVNVNGLMASTLDIKNADFLAGRFRFFAGATAAGIENQGRITTPSGGSIYLIAPDIKNSGIITAPNGDIVLAAGHTVSLVDSGSPDIAAVVSAPADQALNLGQIIAQAGRIGIYGGIIAQKGIVSANSAVRDASGRIFFRATNDITLDTGSVTSANGANGGGIAIRSTEGTTLVSGGVEAKGSNGSGGTVKLLGQQVGLIDQGSINVSGTSGGGTALVGGGYHGQDPSVQNARKTYVGADTSIKADATDKGNGGTVIVWSDDATRAYGAISARGGANGGNGGFAETSGHNYLDFQGKVDTGAPRGSAGTLLLDPADITIDNSTDNLAGGTLGGGYFQNATTNSTLTWSTINTQTGSLEIRTNSSGTGGNGDININANGSITGPTTLTLLANNNINIAAGVSVNGGSADLNLVAGWNNTGWAVTSGTGTITLNAGSSLTTTGNIYFNAGNAVSGASATVTANNLSIGNTGGTSLPGGVNLPGANMVNTLAADLASGGSLTFSNGKNLTIGTGTQGFDGIVAGGNTNPISITTTSGDLTVNAAVQSAGAVSLTSAGAISHSNTAAAINASTLTLSAANGIYGSTAGDSLRTNNPGAATAITASNTGTGPINISDASYAGLSILSGGITQSASGQPVTISSTGALSVNGNVTGSGQVNLTGSGVTVSSATVSGATGVALDAGTGQFGLFSTGAGISTSGTTSGISITADSFSLDSALVGSVINADGTGGLVSIQPKTPGQAIQIDSATRTGGTLGLLSSDFTKITAGTLRLGDANSGAINVAAAIAPTMVNTLTLGSGSTVGQTAAGAISVPNLAVSATGSVNLLTAPNSVANVAAIGGSFSLNNSGNLNVTQVDTISGISGSSAVTLTSGGTITQTQPISTTGTLTTSSVGGTILNAGNNMSSFNATNTGSGGINLTNNIAPLTITGISQSGGGNIAVTGSGPISDIIVGGPISYSGGTPATLTLEAGRAILVNQPISSTSGALNVTLNAHYQSDTDLGGVSITNNITTNGGSLVVGGGLNPATGSAKASNGQLYGVYIDGNASITTGGGNITIHGQGVYNSTQDADGISFWSGQLNANGGNITLVGQAGSTPANSSSGVYIADNITTAGTGSITIHGTGGSNTSASTPNRGVNIAGSTTTISTAGGPIAITGTGGANTANPANPNNTGVLISSGTVTSSGSNIAITGTAGDTASAGIVNSGTINGSTGIVLVAGTGTLTNTGSITNSTGSVVLSADSMKLTGTINANASPVSLVAYSPGTSISIGAGSTGLGLSNAELQTITTTGGLTIAADGGGITVDGAVSGMTNPAGPWTLQTVNGPLTINNSLTVPGSLTISTGGGAVTQNAPITATGLTLLGTGSVSLTNLSNNVGTLVATTTGGISFTNAGNLTIGFVNGTNGITAGGGTISLASTTGTLTLNGPIVNPGGSVSLTADSMALNAVTSGNFISVAPYTATYGINLGGTGVANALNISLSSPTNLTAASMIKLGSLSGGPVSLSSTIGTPGGLSIYSGGAVTQGAGAIIQTPALQVTGADINLPEANTAGVVSGRLTSASGNFIYKTSATAPLSVSTVDGVSGIWASSGGNITLISDATGNGIGQTPGASIRTPGGLALVTPGSAMLTDAGNSVGTLAADLSAGAGSLKYSQNNSLNIGSVLGVAGITAPSGTVSLSSNGGITQTAAITAANLAIKALGDVDLSTAANSVTNVAAFLGDPSNTNRNFSLTNGTASLNVGAAIDGLSGISMQLDTSGYDPANQNGRISLISGGALTQSIGALLAGKAVYAEGTSVNLSQPNPTGMIAGRATGANKGDKFSYASANGIQLTTVGANSGVSAPNVIGSVGIQLTTATNGIGQDGAAPLMTNAGVSLNAAGPVYLTAPGNSVASISAAVTGSAYDLIFTDSTPLTVASPGIATSGNLMLLAPAITISAAGGNTSLSGTTVELQANQAGGTITMSGGKGTPSITAINSAALETDNLVRNSGTITVTASAGDISVHPFTAARPITVGDTACTSSPCLLITDASLSVFNSPVLVIGNDSSGKVSDPTYTPPVSGDIFVGTAGINRGTGTGGTLALVSGGNVSQAGGITVDNLGVKALGSVSLTGTNTVQTLADKSGTLAFSDNAPLTIGTVSGGVPPNNQSLSGVNTNGDAQITASGGLVISSPVNALSGAITLTASSGSITSLNGTGSPDVSGTSLTMSGSGGIGSLTTPLNIQVATLGAANSAGGDIAIKNTGVLTIASLSNTGTGRIWLDNTGAVTTGSSPVKADGDISITAHSPLTIAAGGVTSTSGNITLTAGATGNGATTDNLTLNGPLSGTNITLTAGNAIVENSTVTASGTVNRTANTNLPLPTIGQCIATPTLTGCSAVLPSLTACTATPTLAGCSVVLPSLATCTSSPATAGCSAVLPSLAICTSAPTTAGCSAVLPTLTQCTATPTLAGCSAVLPKLAASQPEETSQPVQQTVNNLAGQINPTITTTQPVVALIPTSLNQSSQPAATSPPSTAQGQQTGSQNPQQGQSMQSSDATPAGPSQSTATDSSSSSQGQTGTTQGQQSGDQGSQANNGQNGQGKQSDKQDEDKKGNKDTTQKTIAEKRDEIKKNKQYCN